MICFFESFNGYLSCYADDLKIVCQHGPKLQQDIDKVIRWFISNKLAVNREKCGIMLLKNGKFKQTSNFTYKLDCFLLPFERDVRDLGVRVDSNFSFQSHVHYVNTSSKRLINLCFKMFASSSLEVFLNFYKIYVIPVIMYCSSIYSLISVQNISRIEKIQKYFTKRLYARLYPKMPIPNYNDRLVVFQLKPLEALLIKSDLCILYRLLNGSLVVPGVSVSRRDRLPGCLQVSSVRTTTSRSFYLHRTIMIWNRFFSYKQFESYAHFKSFIDDLNFIPVYRGNALKAH